MGPGRVRKPLLEIGGVPLLEIACTTFERCPSVAAVVLVVHAEDRATIEDWVETRPAFAKVREVVPGGAERADSVRRGAIVAVQADVDLISVHDAARPLVSQDAIERVHARAAAEGAALLALPVRDTLKHSTDGEHADRTVERAELWAAQTPQVFEATRFRELLERAAKEGFRPTDDAALWERYIGPVALVPGEPTNFKITLPADLELARAILEASP
jgi:2-C-methyl-D-erythritol 4-phosphate cytidylyltransferase